MVVDHSCNRGASAGSFVPAVVEGLTSGRDSAGAMLTGVVVGTSAEQRCFRQNAEVDVSTKKLPLSVRNEPAMDDSKVGDRVRFKAGLWSGAHRRDQIATVVAVHDPPAQGGCVVDIRFEDGQIERGIRVSQLERA
jgi:hypothetical protein